MFKSVISISVFSLSLFALDNGAFDASGLYKVTAVQACAAYVTIACVDGVKKDFDGHTISIVQSGDRKTPEICTTRNFREGLFNTGEFCFSQSTDGSLSLSVTGSGFSGQQQVAGFKNYSQFRRSGAGYTLKEGSSRNNIQVYYIYNLEKISK